MASDQRIRAWRPAVPGIAEVLHAQMTSHVYPMHTHEAWTLLIVDHGSIRYDLHSRCTAPCLSPAASWRRRAALR